MAIVISIAKQTLLLQNDLLSRTYSISTAALGAGEHAGSYQTPRGNHIIRAKVGAGAPLNAVFIARRPTGEVYTPTLAAMYPERDWILSRIMWLSGLELGKNRLGSVDTMRRFIYIHGTPDHLPLGVPASHGCIRMRNQEVIELFDQVSAGEPVSILE